MSRTIAIELTTETRTPTAGVVFSHNRFELFAAAGSPEPSLTPIRPPVDTADPFASFRDVPDGAYSVQVTQMSVTGDIMNTMFGEATVDSGGGGGEPVSYQHAVGMSITVL